MATRIWIRRLLSSAALIALLTANLGLLAQTLAAEQSPACCNAAYCPLHHRPADPGDSSSDCRFTGHEDSNRCSMQACDSVASPVMEIAPFVVKRADTYWHLVEVEAAGQFSLPEVTPSFAAPITPPPRLL